MSDEPETFDEKPWEGAGAALSPADDPYFWVERGWTAYHLRRIPQAHEAANEALKRDPNCETAYYLKGMVALLENDLPQARHFFEQSIAANPDFAGAYCMVGYLMGLAHEKDKDVKAMFDQALALAPFDPMVLYKTAQYYLLQKHDPEKAEQYLDQALSIHPEDIDYLALLAQIRIEQRRYPDAQAIYTEALRLNPEDLDLLNEYAVFLLDYERKTDEAYEVLKTAIRLDPTDGSTRNLMVYTMKTQYPVYLPLYWWNVFTNRLGPFKLLYIVGIYIIFNLIWHLDDLFPGNENIDTIRFALMAGGAGIFLYIIIANLSLNYIIDRQGKA